MTPRRALAAALALVGLAACGGHAVSGALPTDGGADGTTVGADSTAAVDASPPDSFTDASPLAMPLPDFCDGGLFVELSDDAGIKRITASCVDAGPPVPTIASYLPGEDCLGKELTACEALASVRLATGCAECISGSCSMRAAYDDGEGGVFGIEGDGGSLLPWGNAQVQLSPRPLDGGVVGGTFTATFTGIADDAGLVPSKAFTGRFCVLSL